MCSIGEWLLNHQFVFVNLVNSGFCLYIAQCRREKTTRFVFLFLFNLSQEPVETKYCVSRSKYCSPPSPCCSSFSWSPPAEYCFNTTPSRTHSKQETIRTQQVRYSMKENATQTIAPKTTMSSFLPHTVYSCYK